MSGMYLEARRLGRYTYIHYIVPNDWEKVENWRTGELAIVSVSSQVLVVV